MNFLQLMDVAWDWSDKVVSAVDKILVPILIIACSVGMIYAIVVGIQMMKADDKSKRDESKARLINIAISIVAIAVLIGLFYALRAWLKNEKDTISNDLGNLFSKVESPLLNTFSLVKQCARMAIFKC